MSNSVNPVIWPDQTFRVSDVNCTFDSLSITLTPAVSFHLKCKYNEGLHREEQAGQINTRVISQVYLCSTSSQIKSQRVTQAHSDNPGPNPRTSKEQSKAPQSPGEKRERHPNQTAGSKWIAQISPQDVLRQILGQLHQS